MEVFGHQDPAHDAKVLGGAHLVECAGKVVSEPFGTKDGCAPVSAGGQEVEMIQTIVVLLTRHGVNFTSGIAHMANTAMCAPPGKGRSVPVLECLLTLAAVEVFCAG